MAQRLFVDTQIFETPQCVQGTPLRMLANRYTISPSGADSTNGVTILLVHASGTHKEHWEPTVEALFRLQTDSESIREAWAVEWMSHGDSAALNAELHQKSDIGTSIGDWGEAIAAFVKTHLSSHRIVIIGHSAGCSSTMYSTKCFSGLPRVLYEAVILVEPPMIDRQVYQDNLEDRKRQIGMLTKIISAQRSQWDSRVAAYEWFAKRFPWKAWDDRVLRIFINQGLRPVDASSATGPVTTKCQKKHEAANYTDFEPVFQATEQIEKICQDVPIHFIFAEKNDLVPRYSQDSIVDPSKGRHAASITRVPGAVHMVVQQKPDALAESLFKCVFSKQMPPARL
ncbi:hypothetical protein AZE42_08162 [Rhizopogon vesiculosus]|uniref:AB hydrolase-1 domain-containing protein n=1 Tax=Rhizopogon vesiculosus TaxID=180088 RepID=A0A1J8R8E6_9AGAM|nr:hypothetical protein AZE42_08162 [Rhizopogon vesiculosus]